MCAEILCLAEATIGDYCRAHAPLEAIHARDQAARGNGVPHLVTPEPRPVAAAPAREGPRAGTLTPATPAGPTPPAAATLAVTLNGSELHLTFDELLACGRLIEAINSCTRNLGIARSRVADLLHTLADAL